MIKLLFIVPLISSLLLMTLKSEKLNKAILIWNSILYCFISVYLYRYGIGIISDSTDLFSVYFNVDSLNILFLLILSTVFLGVSIYNNGFINSNAYKKGELAYYSTGILLFVFSMTGAILSTNLGLSWVFIEATTLASAYLIYFNKTKHSIEAAWKYVFICSTGIALAFVGIILLSISTGKLNSLFYSDLYLYASKLNPFWLKLSFVFTLVGIGTKMGLAPVHSWLPDAHAEAPSPISALLSATLLNTAFLIILRFFKLMQLAHLDYYAQILLVCMGILSLFVTAVFVFNINNYKRMLAYSSIENMGIMALGTAIGGVAVYAVLFHLVAHSLIKASFFLTAGNLLKIFKTKKIDEISGVIRVDKVTGWLWVACFVGIAGLPPSPLFISEFLLLKSMIERNQVTIAVIFSILLTIILYGIGKSVIKMSFGTVKIHGTECSQDLIEKYCKKLHFSMYIPQIVFITASLILGIYMPQFLSHLIKNAVSAISII